MPTSAGLVAGGGPGTPAFTFEPSQQPPFPPTGLTATAAGSSKVDLSWTAPPPTRGSPVTGHRSPVTGYNIYQGTSPLSESSTPVNSAPITGTTYPVTGLTGGTTYYFQVTAVDAAGDESDSSTRRRLPRPERPPGRPAPPHCHG